VKTGNQITVTRQIWVLRFNAVALTGMMQQELNAWRAKGTEPRFFGLTQHTLTTVTEKQTVG
jgi:hypothetical protein